MSKITVKIKDRSNFEGSTLGIWAKSPYMSNVHVINVIAERIPHWTAPDKTSKIVSYEKALTSGSNTIEMPELHNCSYDDVTFKFANPTSFAGNEIISGSPTRESNGSYTYKVYYSSNPEKVSGADFVEAFGTNTLHAVRNGEVIAMINITIVADFDEGTEIIIPLGTDLIVGREYKVVIEDDAAYDRNKFAIKGSGKMVFNQLTGNTTINGEAEPGITRSFDMQYDVNEQGILHVTSSTLMSNPNRKRFKVPIRPVTLIPESAFALGSDISADMNPWDTITYNDKPVLTGTGTYSYAKLAAWGNTLDNSNDLALETLAGNRPTLLIGTWEFASGAAQPLWFTQVTLADGITPENIKIQTVTGTPFTYELAYFTSSAPIGGSTPERKLYLTIPDTTENYEKWRNIVNTAQSGVIALVTHPTNLEMYPLHLTLTLKPSGSAPEASSALTVEYTSAAPSTANIIWCDTIQRADKIADEWGANGKMPTQAMTMLTGQDGLVHTMKYGENTFIQYLTGDSGSTWLQYKVGMASTQPAELTCVVMWTNDVSGLRGSVMRTLEPNAVMSNTKPYLIDLNNIGDIL